VVRHTAVVYDRFPLWLEAIEGVLRGEGFDPVATTRDADEALELVQAGEPLVFVVGAEADSLEAEALVHVRRACEQSPGVKVVVLAPEPDAVSIGAAHKAGAFAYVLKTADPNDFAAAIRQTAEHTLYFPAPARTTEVAPRTHVTRALTPREIEVLRLAAEGHSNADVAGLLWVTEQTVKFHLSNIYKKLEISNRTEASRWAQIHGLLRPAA
jgi:DNA-binding NarL/FixJ family response regulator